MPPILVLGVIEAQTEKSRIATAMFLSDAEANVFDVEEDLIRWLH